MLKILGRFVPDWLNESRQLARWDVEERRVLLVRGERANESVAPYIALVALVLFPFLLFIDIHRFETRSALPSNVQLLYVFAGASHVLLVLSALPALALRSPRVSGGSPLAGSLLALHLISFISALMILAAVTMIDRGNFLRLSALLMTVNFVYILHWRVRAAVNLFAFLSGIVVMVTFVTLAAVKTTEPQNFIEEFMGFSGILTVIALSVIGGAIVHRDRTEGFIAQYHESLSLARLQREIRIAAQLQQSLLPAPWPTTDGYAVQGLMRPAQDVGGDFYDHFHVQDGAACLVVADVCGKGIPAGLFAMSAKSTIFATTLQFNRVVATQDPAILMVDVNNLLHEGNTDMLFVTAVYGHYQPASGRLIFVNAGHVQPLLLPNLGPAQWLDAPKGCALGVRSGQSYKSAEIELQAGDTVLFISDGVTEALNPDFEEFGSARVKSALEGIAYEAPAQCIQRLLAALDVFTERVAQSDDITCLALCHQPTRSSLES